MLRVIVLTIAIALIAGGAAAQTQQPLNQIIVTGIGSVERAPDWASITLTVVGEGRTSVEAIRAMTARQATISDQLARLVGVSAVTLRTGEVKIAEVRGAACEQGMEFRPKPMLSEGDCAIVGYVATIDLIAKISPPERAGDAVSLAAELGGRDAQLASVGLNDPGALRDAAIKDAVANARAQAIAIAAASGIRLGPIVQISDRGLSDFEDGAISLDMPPPTDRPPSKASALIQLSLPPMQDSARLTVTFTILP